MAEGFSPVNKNTRFGMRLVYLTEPECPCLTGETFKSTMKWKGATENVVVEVEPGEVLFHRRIIFSLLGDVDDLPAKKMVPSVVAGQHFLATDMSYGFEDGMCHVLNDFLFVESTVSGFINGPLNKSKVNIVEDKLNSYSGGDTSRVIKKKYYNGFESTVMYDAKEGSSSFHPVSPKSKGHGYYLLDVFRHGVGDDIYVPKMDAYTWLAKKEAAKQAMDVEKDSKAAKSGLTFDEGPGVFPLRKRLNHFTSMKSRFRSDFKIYWYK